MSIGYQGHVFPSSLVVVTVLYLMCLSLIVLTPVKSGYAGIPDPGRELQVPIDCARTRGTRDDDYRVFAGPGQNGPMTLYCYYPLSRFRALFPEYDDMSDRRLVVNLYQQVGKPPPKSRSFLEIALFRLIVRFYFSIPMLIGGGFLVRAIVKAVRRNQPRA